MSNIKSVVPEALEHVSDKYMIVCDDEYERELFSDNCTISDFEDCHSDEEPDLVSSDDDRDGDSSVGCHDSDDEDGDDGFGWYPPSDGGSSVGDHDSDEEDWYGLPLHEQSERKPLERNPDPRGVGARN